jgi:hypothetical protein
MQTIVIHMGLSMLIMNTIAGAIDGEVRLKIDRSIAINPISRSNRFYTHSSIRLCLHFVGTAL